MYDHTIALIEDAYTKRNELNHPHNKQLKHQVKTAITTIITALELGNLRVATPARTSESKLSWEVNFWVKKAILLSFIINENHLINSQFFKHIDKIPPRFTDADCAYMTSLQTRIVPPAYIRAGAYLGKNTIVMPSFINIGAFVDDGTMIDSWATVGSCAQVGKNVHISSGVTLGGVLEPMQDLPTIIEDNCFIGANAAIVEGVIVSQNAVIGAGVILTQSTKIYDRATDQIMYGRVPPNAVVVPGSIMAPNHKSALNCAVIIKTIDQTTLNKTEINQIIRNFT